MINKNNVDVSLLITFHSEGVLAHSTLNSIERCRKFAELAGITTEYVWVLDSVNEETRKVLLAHSAVAGNVQIIEVSHCDLGASRNSGIECARGECIAILDGDDYFSENWIERAWVTQRLFGETAILHPELVINFGQHSAYGWQVEQSDPKFKKNGLLVGNYWTSWTFSYKKTYEIVPYTTTRPLETGFGYEDWHWNCETIASGFQHRLVPKTIGFYRRKKKSLVTSTFEVGAVIPFTRFFSK